MIITCEKTSRPDHLSAGGKFVTPACISLHRQCQQHERLRRAVYILGTRGNSPRHHTDAQTLMRRAYVQRSRNTYNATIMRMAVFRSGLSAPRLFAVAVLALVGITAPVLYAGAQSRGGYHRACPCSDASAQLRPMLDAELRFWDEWLKTGGMKWKTAFAQLVQVRELRDDTKWNLSQESIKGGRPIRILDAGSGPLTVLGSVWKGKDLDVRAADVLAHSYAELIHKYSVSPPVRAIKAELEKLSSASGDSLTWSTSGTPWTKRGIPLERFAKQWRSRTDRASFC